MIIGFASKETEKVWRGEVSHKLPREIQQAALRKLFMLDKAQVLNDLRIPPANRLAVVVETASDNHQLRIGCPIHQSVRVINAPGPVA